MRIYRHTDPAAHKKVGNLYVSEDCSYRWENGIKGSRKNFYDYNYETWLKEALAYGKIIRLDFAYYYEKIQTN